jgi:dethiobiotin synthetase
VAGRLLVVSGTGTSIGKTHVSEALLQALRGTFSRVAGLKPIESGVGEGDVTDRQRLDDAASFHVKQLGYQFAEPLSPHLAARQHGQTIELGAIRSMVAGVRDAADLTLVELPGGLFTPLSQSLLNVDVVRDLNADFVLLVAPDRLGVLHDVLAATRAAASVGLAFSSVVLVAQETPDPSTGRNASELLLFIGSTPVYEVPRASVTDLATHASLVALARKISGPHDLAALESRHGASDRIRKA